MSLRVALSQESMLFQWRKVVERHFRGEEVVAVVFLYYRGPSAILWKNHGERCTCTSDHNSERVCATATQSKVVTLASAIPGLGNLILFLSSVRINVGLLWLLFLISSLERLYGSRECARSQSSWTRARESKAKQHQTNLQKHWCTLLFPAELTRLIQ